MVLMKTFPRPHNLCLCITLIHFIRVRNLKFARNLKFTTSKTLVNFMKKMMFLSKNWYFSVQKALIYYTVNKSHHNSFILLVFSQVANFRYVANFRFLTLIILESAWQRLSTIKVQKRIESYQNGWLKGWRKAVHCRVRNLKFARNLNFATSKNPT